MKEPRVAIALLQTFCREEALIGDILEEYGRRQSRVWLWRQVGMAVLFGLPYGLTGRPRRGSMPMPIGGLGLLGVIALITLVAPGAWWLIGVGIVGGAVVAATLIVISRSRPPKAGSTHLLR